jgi:hypothetical protein
MQLIPGGTEAPPCVSEQGHCAGRPLRGHHLQRRSSVLKALIGRLTGILEAALLTQDGIEGRSHRPVRFD